MRTGIRIVRIALVGSLLIALVAEGVFLLRYLPTVREAVEIDGAIMLVLGTTSLFLACWLPTTRMNLRFLWAGVSLGCSGFLLFLAYVLMIRW